MKKPVILSICVLFVLSVIFSSCAGGATARDSGAVFADMEAKEWILSAINRSGQIVPMDRSALDVIGMGGAFTISFQGDRVSGMGAPNRYFGPFSAGPGRALSIGNLASTMMAAIFQPEALKEHEYFAYLSAVTSWDLREGKLELYSSSQDGTQIMLIFMPN